MQIGVINSNYRVHARVYGTIVLRGDVDLQIIDFISLIWFTIELLIGGVASLK